MKKFLAILLSLYLVLFLIDAGLSVADDSLIVFWGIHLSIFSVGRAFSSFFNVLSSILVYLLMGLTPLIPKRLFLPLTLFMPAAYLATIPFLIYYFDHVEQISLVASVAQVVLGSGVLFSALRGGKSRWPLIPAEQLAGKTFGGLNLAGFVSANIFVLLPACFLCLAFYTSLAVDHFSGGFLVLHVDRLSVRAEKFSRTDGKIIQLIPMMHIGDADFYRQVSASFPADSVILLEGVTDQDHLLKQEYSYKRAAATLGLTEQRDEFSAAQGQPLRADIDINQFTAETIGILNIIAAINAKGLSLETILPLLEKSPDAAFLERLQDDLLIKRNDHLLQEIQTVLAQYNIIEVPWGAGHMPGVAAGIQKSGFKPADGREYDILFFKNILRNFLSPPQSSKAEPSKVSLLKIQRSTPISTDSSHE